MGGVRARKNTLITAVKSHVLAGKLSAEEAAGFELMYRRCRTMGEQDQVTAAVHHALDGWKDPGKGGAAGGAFAHLQRLKAGIDLYSTNGEDDEEDSPALARARVNVRGRV